jgi:hypothetical protein
MTSELTACPGCGKETTTIAGRCPNCGRLKDPRREPPPRYLARGSAGGLFDDFDLFSWWGAGGIGVLILAAAVLLLTDVVVLAVIAALAIPLLVYALVSWVRRRA